MQINEAFEIPVFLNEIYHRFHLHFRIGMESMVHFGARIATGSLSCGGGPSRNSNPRKQKYRTLQPEEGQKVLAMGRPLLAAPKNLAHVCVFCGAGAEVESPGVGSATAEKENWQDSFKRIELTLYCITNSCHK